ncbi:MAG: aldo/keto reductase [Myxococcales bacterium]|nr:aldo/keto reductase [Myxococcales bacterium]
MQYRNLGSSGVNVSTLCLGAMTFGEADESSFMHKVGCDERTAHAICDRAVEAGINFIDVADIYGQDGLSERVLGSWLAASGRRDELVVATKFRFRMKPHANGSGASRFHIVRACDESLKRLRTDRIDLYQIHMQDITVPEEETLRALDDLVRQGKVLYIGCSNYAAYRMVQSLGIADKRGYAGYVALQAQYSLIERNLEREHIPACREFGLGLLPWSPLAGGFLTGKYRRGTQAPSGARLERTRFNYSYYDKEQNWRVLDTLLQVAEESGGSPAQVALAWLLRRPQVSSVIFGCRSLEQLDQNLAAESLTLSDEQVARLEEVSRPDWGYPYSFIRGVQERW